MHNTICNNLTNISISIIIAFIFTLLFYTGIVTEISILLIFSLIFSLLSLLVISLLGISDNGLTRQKLCQNSFTLLVTIIGNILLTLLALTLSPTIRKTYINYYYRILYFFLFIKFVSFNSSIIFTFSIYLKGAVWRLL